MTYRKNGKIVTLDWVEIRSRPDVNGCWIWSLSKDPRPGREYGTASLCSVRQGAHRFAWEIANGRRIPDGMEIDHTCYQPSCVNPEHLELVTHAENVARRRPYSTARPVCGRGHEMAGDNIKIQASGKRRCRECDLIHQRAYYARQKASGNWKPSKARKGQRDVRAA